MEQSLENTDSHSHPKTQTESDAIRTMLQHALELDDVGFYEEAFLAGDAIAFVIRPEAIVEEDE